MARYPKLRLSRLRDIGWSQWDPIGIMEPGMRWESHAAADEYDGYLFAVANQLCAGGSDEDSILYLIKVETHRIGLTPRDDTEPRARRTVEAIRDYLAGLPDAPEHLLNR